MMLSVFTNVYQSYRLEDSIWKSNMQQRTLYPEYKKNPQNWKKKIENVQPSFLIGKIAQCIFQQSWHMDDVK